MNERRTLYDHSHNLLATATVIRYGDRYIGTADTAKMPPSARRIFERFEKLMDDQVVSILEAAAQEIALMDIISVSDDGTVASLEDVQILPRARTVSFKEGIHLTYPQSG